MNTVEFTRKQKIRAGNYRYTFLVNGEELALYVQQYYNPDTGVNSGWMFTDNGSEDAGQYSTSKAKALYALCCYLLTRYFDPKYGFCCKDIDVAEQAEALYQTITK